MLACVSVLSVALTSQNGATATRGNNEDKTTGAAEKQISEGELLLQARFSDCMSNSCLIASPEMRILAAPPEIPWPCDWFSD
ncbi:hypothetical protein ILYODFUR_031424 [Ilyodon furcidens]|uniref:Secreted protein n=1 Tax=Ilyodon furcidens TaxID=33524 RepID=A0ABV0ULY8_9TELE